MLGGRFRLLATTSSAQMHRPTIRRSWSCRRTVTRTWIRNEDCGAHPLRDTLSQLRLRELLIEVQDRVEQIVKGAVSSWDPGRIGRGGVRGIVHTIRFGFVLYIDIDCIRVADFMRFLGRNQSERVGRW